MLIVSYDGKPIHIQENGGGTVAVEFDESRQYRCTQCGKTFASKDAAENNECTERETCAVHTGDDNCDDHDCSFPHAVREERAPLAWANSVAIELDTERDEINLLMSLGDPRHAFTMRVWRTNDGALRMKVPHPDNSFPHLPLTQINSGTYVVEQE